jgi:GNAT superfamily N-acetyltransferase
MEANPESAVPALSPTEDDRAPVRPVGYPEDIERDVVDADGLRFQLRPIRPDDAAGLVAFHGHLSSHSVYLRFFTFHPVLTEAEVLRFTTVDYIDRLALVVTHEGRIVAVGRFDRPAGSCEAEVAFVVADEFQHHGIGSLLLDELASAARQRGIDTFKADTLAENQAMLDVFRHAGFPVTSSVDFGTVSLRFPIAVTDAYRAALDAREASRAGWHGSAP